MALFHENKRQNDSFILEETNNNRAMYYMANSNLDNQHEKIMFIIYSTLIKVQTIF